jgi:hypothetical protein
VIVAVVTILDRALGVCCLLRDNWGGLLSLLTLETFSLYFLLVSTQLQVLNLFFLPREVECHKAKLVEHEIIFVHFLKCILKIINTSEVLPYFDWLGRLLFHGLLLFLLLSGLFLFFLLLLLGLVRVDSFECSLLLFLLLDFLKSGGPPLLLGLLWQSVCGLYIVLDVSEADHNGPYILHDPLVEADAPLLHPLAELLHIHTLLVRDLAVLVHEDLLDGVQVLAEVHAEAGAGLPVAREEPLQGLQQGRQVEVGRLLVGLLLLVEATLLPHACEGGTLLLWLRLLSEGLLSRGRKTVRVVFAPVREVAVTLHIALGETEDLQSLEQELLLCEGIAH